MGVAPLIAVAAGTMLGVLFSFAMPGFRIGQPISVPGWQPSR
jgi:hypothetical protein